MKVSLHPLVLLNLSDHHIRQTQANIPENSPLLGVLMGEKSISKDTLQKINIINSFEIALKSNNEIDYEYLEKRFQQNRVIYPTEELVGLYQIVNGEDLSITDDLKDLKTILQKEKLISESNQSTDIPLISLVFSPKLSQKKYSNKKFLRLFDYENIELKYDIETKESEKVAIDTVLELKESDNYNDHDKAKDQLGDQGFLLKTLRNKLELVALTLDKIPHLDDNELERENKLASIDPKIFQILRDTNAFVSKISYKQSSKVKKNISDLETDLNLTLNIGLVDKNTKSLEKTSNDLRKLEGLRDYY